jgi:hypothetical protein
MRRVSSLSPDLIAIFVLHRLAAVCSANTIRCSIGIYRLLEKESTAHSVCLLTNHMRAIILIIRLALRTFHARLNLRSNANTISWLDSLDLRPNSQDLANDLVANADRCVSDLSPAPGDCVDVRAADAAAFVLDIDVVVLEDFGSEL